LTTHFLVAIIWLTVITLLRWSWHWNLVWLWLGGLFGTYFFDLDHFLYLLVINPHELTSQRVQRLLQQKKFKETLVLVTETASERTHLPLHSALFQIINLVLCLFVLTSTNNLFGSGMVMGMALHLLKDEIGEVLGKQEERLKRWLFWQVKFEVSLESQKIYLVVVTLIFLALNWLLV
jgi:hypothetical protein